MTVKCRNCNHTLDSKIISLGHQPLSNAYLTYEQLHDKEVTYPLDVFICGNCSLVQLPQYERSDFIFNEEYAYLSSTSTSWCIHAKSYVEKVVKEFDLKASSNVLEIASNDGYLLKNFVDKNIPCLGIEPTSIAAKISQSKGINTIERFFGTELAQELISSTSEIGYDLIIGNNVLAHVPDLNDFIQGLSIVLAKDGIMTFEFPHLQELINNLQFDTIYHEHFSYFTAFVLQNIFAKYQLTLFRIEKINTHGGSLRIWIKHNSNKKLSVEDSVGIVIENEIKNNLHKIEGYQGFSSKVIEIKNDLITFLLEKYKAGQKVIAYGAAAKGNTFLNFAGIKDDMIQFVVDNAKTKQGKYMPGSKIPIYSPDVLKEISDASILILPWNIADEISKLIQDNEVYTAIPSLRRIK